jgi:hypothetical protein
VKRRKDIHSSLKLRLRRIPDFWGPMDIIGVPKLDFPSLRMTALRRSSADGLGQNLPTLRSSAQGRL